MFLDAAMISRRAVYSGKIPPKLNSYRNFSSRQCEENEFSVSLSERIFLRSLFPLACIIRTESYE